MEYPTDKRHLLDPRGQELREMLAYGAAMGGWLALLMLATAGALLWLEVGWR